MRECLPCQGADVRPVERAPFVEVGPPVVVEEFRVADEEVPLAGLFQAPDGGPADLGIRIVEGRDQGGAECVDVIACKGAESAYGPENSGPEVVEILFGHGPFGALAKLQLSILTKHQPAAPKGHDRIIGNIVPGAVENPV